MRPCAGPSRRACAASRSSSGPHSDPALLPPRSRPRWVAIRSISPCASASSRIAASGRCCSATTPEARSEYVVVVEVAIDVDRVRERLARAGLLLTPAGEAQRSPRATDRGGPRGFRGLPRAARDADRGRGGALRAAGRAGAGTSRARDRHQARGRGAAGRAAARRPPRCNATPSRRRPGRSSLRVHLRARAGSPAARLRRRLTRRIQIGIEFAFLANTRHVARSGRAPP